MTAEVLIQVSEYFLQLFLVFLVSLESPHRDEVPLRRFRGV